MIPLPAPKKDLLIVSVAGFLALFVLQALRLKVTSGKGAHFRLLQHPVSPGSNMEFSESNIGISRAMNGIFCTMSGSLGKVSCVIFSRLAEREA